ncbi:MAG: ATP-binding protein [Boseongicola sp.]|nr:ATP-binding protein [Boseongicola sp.]
MSKNHWHYPRTEFTDRTFKLLVNGPVSALRMFGPRRTGKTWFLTNDLAPRFEMYGHRVVYANFWQIVSSPLAVMLYACDQALRKQTFAERLLQRVQPKVELSGLGAKLELDLTSEAEGTTPPDQLLWLDQYLDRLADPKKPTLLMFDEFQEIALASGSDALMAALRTGLDTRQDALVAVFTGSSEAGLNALFSAENAPFFRYGQRWDLPMLDDEFVRHQLKAYTRSGGADIPFDEARAVFEKYDNSPMYFRDWLTVRLADPSLDAAAAQDAVEKAIEDSAGFRDTWLQISGPQRATLRLVADGVGQLFGEEAQTHLAGIGLTHRPTGDQINAAIQGLNRKKHKSIVKWQNRWHVRDSFFAAWVRRRGAEEF